MNIAEIRHGSYESVIQERADLIFTSPPYNIGSKREAITGQRNAKLGTYDPKSYRAIREYPDNLPESEYQQQQIGFLLWTLTHVQRHGVIVYNHKVRRRDHRAIHPLQWILKVPGLVLLDEIVWDRGSTHNHSKGLMWPQTERLFVLRPACGTFRLENHAGLPQRSDVWRITKARNNGHNAPFPEALAEAVIAAYSKPGDLIVDPYAGSCTAGIVAARMGRNFIGAEREAKYVELSRRRFEDAGIVLDRPEAA